MTEVLVGGAVVDRLEEVVVNSKAEGEAVVDLLAVVEEAL